MFLETQLTIQPYGLDRDFLEAYIPQELAESDADYAIEPRTDSAVCCTLEVANIWPQPDIVKSVGGKIHLPNLKLSSAISISVRYYQSLYPRTVMRKLKATLPVPSLVAQKPM